MYGTGSHAGHAVTCLWFEEDGKRELYIIESQDGWFWPIHKVQRNKFSEWIKMAEAASFHVSHMPLSPEYAAKYNETAAREFFFETEGLPYGYHNFLYGWVDTPNDNWPVILPKNLVPVAFSLIEKFDKNLTDTFFSAGLNMRLGTENLTVGDIAAYAAK